MEPFARDNFENKQFFRFGSALKAAAGCAARRQTKRIEKMGGYTLDRPGELIEWE